MPVIGSNTAAKSKYGLAFPCLVRVWSIKYPIMTLVMASITFEMIGKTIKNMPPHTVVSFNTSV